MSDLITRAANFAKTAHAAQKRKSGSRQEVRDFEAVLVVGAAIIEDDVVVAAGYLHDTVEDTPTTYDQLVTEFGKDVADVVLEVTDVSRPEDGNRATRKALDREHLGNASTRGKSVKLADVISNTRDIVENDPKFGKVYLKEKIMLLPLLRGGNSLLFRAAAETLSWASQKLQTQY